MERASGTFRALSEAHGIVLADDRVTLRRLAVDVGILPLEGDALAFGDLADCRGEGFRDPGRHPNLLLLGLALEWNLFQADVDLVFTHEYLLSCGV